MTSVTWEERILRPQVVDFRQEIPRRLARFALAVAVWALCAVAGALFLQALQSAASR